MVKVLKRKLSLGEILENKRRDKLNQPKNTYTYSIKLGNGWYKIYQAIKKAPLSRR